MIRLAACIWSVVAVVMAVMVFQMKYAVQELEGDLAEVNAQILEDQEAIHVLRAEWSYLNRPERIAGLAERFLGLDPEVEPQRVSLNDLGDLPLRLEGVVVRPADAGPLLPREKPSLLIAAPGSHETAAPPAVVQTARQAPRETPSVQRAAPSNPDPIAATLVKYGGQQ